MQHYHLISSGLVSSPVYSPVVLSCLPSLSLFSSRFLLICPLSPLSPFVLDSLLPSHFPPFFAVLLSFFRSPPYLVPSRRPFNPVSSTRGYPEPPIALFSLGHRLFHSFLTRQTRRPIFLGLGDACYFYLIYLQRFENDTRCDRVQYHLHILHN